jgi:hypothetical protein
LGNFGTSHEMQHKIELGAIKHHNSCCEGLRLN